MDAPSTNPPGDIQAWVYKAEEDFRTATTMVRKRKEPVPDNVCFCAQQCIEKYLKAFLVLHRIHFPRIHDLLALLDFAVDIDTDLEILRDEWYPSKHHYHNYPPKCPVFFRAFFV